jgi:hypothetical protein
MAEQELIMVVLQLQTQAAAAVVAAVLGQVLLVVMADQVLLFLNIHQPILQHLVAE